MDRTNLELYYSSMVPVVKMREAGVINAHEFKIAESFLAEKYCIKISNLYRQIDLLLPKNRAIYMMTKEEEEKDEENSYQTRSITKVSKKD